MKVHTLYVRACRAHGGILIAPTSWARAAINCASAASNNANFVLVMTGLLARAKLALAHRAAQPLAACESRALPCRDLRNVDQLGGDRAGDGDCAKPFAAAEIDIRQWFHKCSFVSDRDRRGHARRVFAPQEAAASPATATKRRSACTCRPKPTKALPIKPGRKGRAELRGRLNRCEYASPTQPGHSFRNVEPTGRAAWRVGLFAMVPSCRQP